MTREEWLIDAVEKLRPLFTLQKLTIPPLKISCGWPSKGGLKPERKTLGECWDSDTTFDGFKHVFVSPTLKENYEVLEVLVKELTHASQADGEKNGANFKAAAKEIGLVGRVTSMSADSILQVKLTEMAESMPEYPNSAIHPKDKEQKDPSKAKKSFKLHCEHKRNCDKKCQLLEKSTGDYVVTLSKPTLLLGMPLCPCGHEMVMEEEDFKVWQTILGEAEQNSEDIKTSTERAPLE